MIFDALGLEGVCEMGCPVSFIGYVCCLQIDEVYPLLDLYGDLLEGLEFRMVNASEPTVDHIRVSFKLDRAGNIC